MELHIRDVSKTYSNGVQALKNVTLTIPPGMYGLLGPNGSGKSTLMRTIATLQEPDSGSIRLGPSTNSGQAIDVVREKDEVRRTLGYLPQSFGKQTIRITVPRAPARAGIDPSNKLIDRNREDNVVDVTIENGDAS